MKRYSYVTDCGVVEDPNGDYVKYSDYEALSKYADSLVEFSKIPCLPADLKNLRKANGHFAQENSILQGRIRELEAEIRWLKAPQSTHTVQTGKYWQTAGWVRSESNNHQNFQ
jgi:hypothetical protein